MKLENSTCPAEVKVKVKIRGASMLKQLAMEDWSTAACIPGLDAALV
jgi:hypothetical protein